MQERGSGRSWNIGTNLFQNPVVPYHDYAAAKAALLSLTRTLAKDLVNTTCRGEAWSPASCCAPPTPVRPPLRRSSTSSPPPPRWTGRRRRSSPTPSCSSPHPGRGRSPDRPGGRRRTGHGVSGHSWRAPQLRLNAFLFGAGHHSAAWRRPDSPPSTWATSPTGSGRPHGRAPTLRRCILRRRPQRRRRRLRAPVVPRAADRPVRHGPGHGADRIGLHHLDQPSPPSTPPDARLPRPHQRRAGRVERGDLHVRRRSPQPRAAGHAQPDSSATPGPRNGAGRPAVVELPGPTTPCSSDRAGLYADPTPGPSRCTTASASRWTDP
ncbi:hypothetical protein QJS66_19670 [Kocuria rhizophila]|nr:hypothetical protein QJS66_19670 [Kocuria rhizophila]